MAVNIPYVNPSDSSGGVLAFSFPHHVAQKIISSTKASNNFLDGVGDVTSFTDQGEDESMIVRAREGSAWMSSRYGVLGGLRRTFGHQALSTQTNRCLSWGGTSQLNAYRCAAAAQTMVGLGQKRLMAACMPKAPENLSTLHPSRSVTPLP